MKQHDFPEIVIISAPVDIYFFFAAQISSTERQWIEDVLNHYSGITNIRALLKDPENLMLDSDLVTVVPYYPALPTEFWKKDKLLPIQFFKRIIPNGESVTYTIYAFHLALNDYLYNLHEDNITYPIPLPKGTHEWNNHRIEQIMKDYNSVKLQKKISKGKLEVVINRLKSFINATIWKETLVNAGAFHHHQQMSQGKNVSHSIFLPYNQTRGEGHSFVVIKSMIGPDWYLIHNDQIKLIKNLKQFLTLKTNPSNFNYFISEILWHESNSYEKYANNAKELLKTVVPNNCITGRKRKLLKNLRSTISTPTIEKQRKNSGKTGSPVNSISAL
ncbi:hypothetical protein SNEBB_005928 [Seison nebaliae]|nr:hypothetical protein SNEBB_005928 [Seison nebaliae]